MAKKKMKVSLDLAKIKSFFVQHVEKIVFGGCALVLLLMLYKAATVETYEREPKEISDKAGEKDRMLQQASWTSDRIEKENLQLPNLGQEIAESRVAVPSEKYRIAPFNEPLFETRTKRTQPTLLPPEKPEVSAELAAFVIQSPSAVVDVNTVAGGPVMLQGEEGGERGFGGKGGGPPALGGKGGGGPPALGGKGGSGMARGMIGRPGMGGGGVPRFGQMAQAGGPDPGFPVAAGQKRVAMPFTVTKMLVPVKKQREIYRNAFVKSVHEDPTKDEPSYRGFIVERQEVGVSDAENKPAEIIKETRWGEVGQRLTIADSLSKRNQTFAGYAAEVADPAVVHPLLTHPLGPKTESGWEVAKVVHSQLVPAVEELIGDDIQVTVTGDVAVTDAAEPKDEGPNPYAEAEATGPTNSFRPSGGMGSKGGGSRMAQVIGRPGAARFQVGLPGAADTEYYLLRFFDFNVEPGKSYRYRVKLGLANPNHGLDAKYLDKPELAKEAYVQTEWSEQTPIVSVPRESYLLVGEANRGTSSSEPSIDLIGVRMVSDLGIKAPVAEPTQYRGQIGNWRGEKADLGTPEQELQPPTPPDGNAKPPKKQPDKTVDVLTDTLLVDIRGGDPLSRSKEPAEALVLTPSGRLSVLSQVTDSEEYRLQQQKIDDWKKRKSGKDDDPLNEPSFAPPGRGGKGGKG